MKKNSPALALRILPRGAASRVVELCTYLWWFGRPDKGGTEPFCELPFPVTNLGQLSIQGWVLTPCHLGRVRGWTPKGV